ncbi:hypothetical protein SOASR030_01710 [Leminorella grimontii]|uniref:Uncharacterized protein n=1 Tax=Leminorella grimontii TaxID=82981 RepID=A0AAV5MZ45_9GAMM|nr:hypothetical protein [Leminorella grimontii]KFC95374.1 hypothetical protein GLGR_1915 [Leminorella grimontii ATCC 33999 = DSM 5078]GKX54059.1 hypothetical protein SOASR030_01710 [Leminorella grimontii]VFS60174.1 Uncharacterised protein [Leminorella grimontii]
MIKREDIRAFADEFAKCFYAQKAGEKLPGQFDYIEESIERMAKRVEAHKSNIKPVVIKSNDEDWQSKINPEDVYPENRRWNGD